ncbi:MAG: hypothetical protein AAGF47_10050 [Planctomycetota bacterium]
MTDQPHDQEQAIRAVRRGTLAAMAVLSTLTAVLLIWVALNPSRVGAMPTAALLVILAMLCLPGLTIAAWRWNRAARKRLGRVLRDLEEDQPRQHAAGRSRPHAALPPDEPAETPADQPRPGAAAQTR